MGLAKTDKFTEEQNDLSKITKALGHPARIAIIQHLAKMNSCVCGDIVQELPLSQSTVSQHLKELKNSGLVKGTIEGPSICYCINPEVWNLAKKKLDDLFDSFRDDVSCC